MCHTFHSKISTFTKQYLAYCVWWWKSTGSTGSLHWLSVWSIRPAAIVAEAMDKASTAKRSLPGCYGRESSRSPSPLCLVSCPVCVCVCLSSGSMAGSCFPARPAPLTVIGRHPATPSRFYSARKLLYCAPTAPGVNLHIDSNGHVGLWSYIHSAKAMQTLLVWIRGKKTTWGWEMTCALVKVKVCNDPPPCPKVKGAKETYWRHPRGRWRSGRRRSCPLCIVLQAPHSRSPGRF